MKIAGTADRLLSIWDAATGTLLLDFQTMNQTYVHTVTWSPDSQKIATASDDQYVRIWNISQSDLQPGQLITEFQPFDVNNGFELLRAVDWSPDGTLLAVGAISDAYSLKLYDTSTYALRQQFRVGWVEKLLWSPVSSEQRIVIAGPNGGPSVALLTGQLTPLGGRNIHSRAFAWSPDGNQIAVGYDDGAIYVWETAENTQLAVMSRTDSNPITQLAWNADGIQLAAANGAVRIWNSATGQQIASLPGISLAAAFSLDGSKLVYGNGPGSIVIVSAPQADVGFCGP